MVVRTRGGDRASRVGGRAEAERDRESVYLSFSSSDSDREQTAEDNEKQICGWEDGEVVWGKGSKNIEEKGGGKGSVTAQKSVGGGVVAFIATGSGSSDVQ